MKYMLALLMTAPLILVACESTQNGKKNDVEKAGTSVGHAVESVAKMPGEMAQYDRLRMEEAKIKEQLRKLEIQRKLLVAEEQDLNAKIKAHIDAE